MSDISASESFSFEISLSVLNHLGRNLYRSFATVLGEAISNSWDAGANNVYIYIDRDSSYFFIKDDGIGMTSEEFQERFLKIGYSKRKDVKAFQPVGRPFIGRKGIGKLALLSCAEKIEIITKTNATEYVGGVIDNSGLDEAIEHDLKPSEYPLEDWELSTFEMYIEGHEQGTIIFFENIKDGIKNTIDFLRKIIARYFRFSLIDPSFKIHVNDVEVTLDDLKDLAQKTQLLWNINDLNDPYLNTLSNLKRQKELTVENGGYKGFIASVEKPRDLKIFSIEERMGVDLFVNGRLREKDILKHIPTARIVESYLYGQIHFDDLDDEVERFTSSRENIVANDPKYESLLDSLKEKVINKVLEDWDKWRRELKQDGDPENKSITKKERKAEELYNEVSKEYELPIDTKNKKRIDSWVAELGSDAIFNFSSYAECFISENLLRRFIQEKKISLSPEANRKFLHWQKKETENKNKGNISIEIRKDPSKLSYLTMDDLANLFDKEDLTTEASLSRDAREYKPVRDALAHTALLTDEAKVKLTTVYFNIKERIRRLLSK
ncbi:DNA mismatch repair protein [candidate division LCP-89 bacterium B3_LCP]|uniref:DNA mismatch repair protein n=1 Tax=candidate division LCP-89 bacterium B3_LCP TaxID=2012998 RepID=A0A532UZY2_UNCL8|nr:MAG: DNA mismatch repair protein [candidate division LCP-89 bacterium B3_LCP]